MKFKTTVTLLALLPAMTLYAQEVSYSKEEQRAWNEHKTEMAEPVEFLAADALASIQSDYTVNPYDVRNLRNLCRQMETHKYLHYFILETAAGRLSIKREIERQYWDSIAPILIPSNPTMAGTYTGYVIQMVNELKLSNDTLFALKTLSLDYARRLRKDPCAYFAKEEMDTLKTLLNRQQLESVINNINAKVVENRCESLWNALEEAGLSVELNKATDLRQASTFYLQEMFVRDYYIGDRPLIDANLNDLYRHKPRCIRMYEGIRLKEAVKKKHEERVGAEFSW